MYSQKQITDLGEPRKNEGTTFLKTCFNTANTLCGVGILSVPYALSKGGWLSLVLLLLVAVVCFYTGLILDKCMNSNPYIKTYPDIGDLAFGRTGRVTVTTFMYIELFLVAVEFLIMEADNVHKLYYKDNFPIFGMEVGWKKVFICFAGLVVLPTTLWGNLKVLSYVSATRVLSTLILVLIILWGGVVDGIGFHETGELWNSSGLTTSISLFTFLYLGHSVFPSIRGSMKNKTQFPKVLLVCFIVSTLSYVSMSILGYIMFGNHLTSQVTLNMPKENVSSKIAISVTLTLPITKYAIIVEPIAAMLEASCPFRGNKMRSCVIRTCLVLSTVIVAITVPFFSHVMAFSGAFVGITLSVLLPCLCYWKIVLGVQNFGIESMMILTIIISGTVVLPVGTYTAVMNIVKELKLANSKEQVTS